MTVSILDKIEILKNKIRKQDEPEGDLKGAIEDAGERVKEVYEKFEESLKFDAREVAIEIATEAYTQFDDPGVVVDLLNSRLETPQRWAEDLAEALKTLKELSPDDNLNWL